LAPVPDGYPRYGNTVVTAPGEWTYLRISMRVVNNEERYTAYTSRDGHTWNHGGTWTHALGSNARIGLISMGGSGFTTSFDYVRVYTLNNKVEQP
jgi:arabinan endo-1,5-alpha-L-arabinosidase